MKFRRQTGYASGGKRRWALAVAIVPETDRMIGVMRRERRIGRID